MRHPAPSRASAAVARSPPRGRRIGMANARGGLFRVQPPDEGGSRRRAGARRRRCLLRGAKLAKLPPAGGLHHLADRRQHPRPQTFRNPRPRAHLPPPGRPRPGRLARAGAPPRRRLARDRAAGRRLHQPRGDDPQRHRRRRQQARPPRRRASARRRRALPRPAPGAHAPARRVAHPRRPQRPGAAAPRHGGDGGDPRATATPAGWRSPTWSPSRDAGDRRAVPARHGARRLPPRPRLRGDDHRARGGVHAPAARRRRRDRTGAGTGDRRAAATTSASPRRSSWCARRG